MLPERRTQLTSVLSFHLPVRITDIRATIKSLKVLKFIFDKSCLLVRLLVCLSCILYCLYSLRRKASAGCILNFWR